MNRCVVLDGYALNPGDLSWDPLAQLLPLDVFDRTAPEDLLARASGAAFLLTNKMRLDRATLAALPDLRYIGVLATGYDVVDVAAARERGIAVTNIPAYGTASVAQFTIALLLELCHRAQLHADAVARGEWERNPDWSFAKTPLVELEGKTLGIVGYGRIGARVGEIAQALGMRILTRIPREQLLAESDVLTLHCPLTPETRHMIDARALSLMKPSAFLINTARGGLVVEQDLADALNASGLAGAAVDVLPVEPPRAPSPLFTARNCIVTPHIAWATREARARLLEMAAANVRAFLTNAPINVVSR